MTTALGIAGVLDESRRSGGGDQLAGQTSGKTDPGSFDLGPAPPVDLQRLGKTVDLDSDLLQQPVGVLFDQFQSFRVEHLDR